MRRPSPMTATVLAATATSPLLGASVSTEHGAVNRRWTWSAVRSNCTAPTARLYDSINLLVDRRQTLSHGRRCWKFWRRIVGPEGGLMTQRDSRDAGRTVVALQLELSEEVLDRSVTLARALLQSRAIEHFDATVRIADDALLLQPAGDHVHGLARGPEHHREELLTQLKRLAPRAVMRHQQPPTTAGIHRVEGETCGGLHHQAHKSLTVMF